MLNKIIFNINNVLGNNIFFKLNIKLYQFREIYINNYLSFMNLYNRSLIVDKSNFKNTNVLNNLISHEYL